VGFLREKKFESEIARLSAEVVKTTDTEDELY
jgi:hypothetical protein